MQQWDVLVRCHICYLGLEYKALALSDSTKLKLCTPKKQIDSVLVPLVFQP